MQPDHRWPVGRPFEITLHGIVELGLQILDRFTLCMDTTTQRRSGISTRWVFENFKDDFFHGVILKDKDRSCKAILVHPAGARGGGHQFLIGMAEGNVEWDDVAGNHCSGTL
jgi:hypothetical protein